jgi:hypothetical protein
MGKTILVTFAGRRDRMALLCDYARAALARGLVDEWHVWDFARHPEDREWLHQNFRLVRFTPGDGIAYFLSGATLELGAQPLRYSFQVACPGGDAQLGLMPITGAGQSYEVTLGEAAGSASAIRVFEPAVALLNAFERDPVRDRLARRDTPGVLPRGGFVTITVELAPNGLRVFAGEAEVIAWSGAVAPATYVVFYRSAAGPAEWRFPGWPARGSYLFLPPPPRADQPKFGAFYQHYVRHGGAYADDIFLKCDDDIVFADLDRLGEFIAYRRAHPEIFLLSANVVNNGVCAYFQQQAGLIPEAVVPLELPPGGFAGTLWAMPAKAQAVHEHFLRNASSFRAMPGHVIPWAERISINFVSWLGADLVHMPELMEDDEVHLSYGAPATAGKFNAIFMGFVVSHLSFYPQDPGLDIAGLLAGYRGLVQGKEVRGAF